MPRLLALLAAFALVLAACGEGDDTTDTTDTEVATDDPDTADDDAEDPGDAPETGTSDDPAGVEVTGELGEKPQIDLPGGDQPEGLRIVDLVEGDGAEAQPGDEVTTHYVGVSWLNDGEQFDASWDRGEPATFPLDAVIQGWQEGIPGMREGGRRLLVIPPEQGYGPQGRPPAIAENDTLVFVIDLIDPEDIEEPTVQIPTGDDDPAGVEVSDDLDAKPEITLPEGDPPADLRVVDLVVGDGDEAQPNATVTTHYVGVSWLNDGEQFDASWDRGEPISFGLNQVIAGWTEGIPGMRVGGRRLLVIPPDKGYGAQSPTPAIAPNDTLVFVIDLVDLP